jgi:acetyl esterase/lipase
MAIIDTMRSDEFGDAAWCPLVWENLTDRDRAAPDHHLRYGSDSLQSIDLWLPVLAATRTTLPTVVMVHGGCWQSAIADRRLMDWVAADLRDAGVAVWNIDYRGVDRAGGGYPGTFHDVAMAADLLLDAAATYALDLSRLVAVGHSAGGHLALWLAARHRLPPASPLAATAPLPISHVVSLGGLPDLAAVEASPDNGCGTDVIARLVGAGRSDRFTDTSIPCLLPIGVPQTLIDGRDDRIVPDRLGAAYAAAAQAAGDVVERIVVPQTGHVELIAPGSGAWGVAKKCILRALGR